MKYKKGSDDAGDGNQDGGTMMKTSSAPPSIEIVEHRAGAGASRLGSGGGGSISFSEPWREMTPGSGGSGHGSSDRRGPREPPEKRLTLFALRLAVLEKAASGLGKLDFAWATVVLLGGFASSLNITDFWCVTVILVGEGARVFSRSHELEWQHHATLTSTAGDALRTSSRFFRHVTRAIFRPRSAAASLARVRALQFQQQVVAIMKQRTWHAPDVPLIPYSGWVFVSKKIGRLLNWLQMLSALACVALSVMRLWKQDFHDDGVQNMRPALLLFYTLALLEASLFLLEKSYWWWKMSVCKLLDEVSAECELGPYGLVSLKRFFYDAYSQCIDGSIFDGIKMDLVTFAEELIQSDFLDEQLIGVRILQQLATSKGSARDTLRKLGTNPRSIERVVEMLNWKRPDEEEVRQCAAEVVSNLAGKRQNALRVSAIPGAIESVMSMLYTGRAPTKGKGAEEHDDRIYDYLKFNLLGLRVLKKLARDHDNCGKIGNARGLLAKIVEFSHASPALLRNTTAPDSQIRAVKRALQVIKMLVYTTGATGKALRRDVAENVFTVSNLRGVLQHGHQHMELQKLAMDILTGMAMDERANETIAGTGGVVRLLLSIFFNSQELELGCEAGEALAMLALESEASCSAILKARPDVVDQLVSAVVERDARYLNATRLLRNLCAYSGEEYRTRLSAVTKAMPAVLRATMTGHDKILELSVGMTTQICAFMDCDQFAAELRGVGLDERAYVQRLAVILRQYPYPQVNVPRMRRFVVQQLVWLMTASSPTQRAGGGGGFAELLRDRGLGVERLLEAIADTTSEVECYHVFSGSVPISKHRESFSAIVESALRLVADGDDAVGGGRSGASFG